MTYGTVRPLGPLTLYWGRCRLPSIAPIRLSGSFAEVIVRDRYIGICWR